ALPRIAEPAATRRLDDERVPRFQADVDRLRRDGDDPAGAGDPQVRARPGVVTAEPSGRRRGEAVGAHADERVLEQPERRAHPGTAAPPPGAARVGDELDGLHAQPAARLDGLDLRDLVAADPEVQ